ncbi:ABC transporter ATP-binding protein [Slackia heliotrinireducens]|uniref:ABC transporter ATP-binding protein n=1 Tax=Slackia heliotrinireducens TaxID=84110 RepID=UPI0033153747
MSGTLLSTPVVKAEHVAFSYVEGKPVLKDINFEVHAGEILMILGANGCGKTTLMRTLIGDCKRFSGTIEIKGRNLTEYSDLDMARNVAMVFQDHNAPFPFSVMDVVKMARAPYLSVFGRPSKRDIAIAEEALEAVGMSHVAEEPYTNLSGGQRQMVLIARALAQQTDLILMDEPTSSLDYRNSAIVINAAARLATEQGKAVIMITHAPDQAFYYKSKSALMKGGRFFAYGPSEEVLTSENLSEVYNMRIKVLEATDVQTNEKYLSCRPVPESA